MPTLPCIMAKRSGKNKFSLFEQDLAAAQAKALQMKQCCTNAIREQQFSLEYQPLYDSRTNRVIGVETLLRCTHPTAGRSNPRELIQILEKNDLMTTVDDMVFQ